MKRSCFIELRPSHKKVRNRSHTKYFSTELKKTHGAKGFLVFELYGRDIQVKKTNTKRALWTGCNNVAS